MLVCLWKYISTGQHDSNCSNRSYLVLSSPGKVRSRIPPQVKSYRSLQRHVVKGLSRILRGDVALYAVAEMELGFAKSMLPWIQGV